MSADLAEGNFLNIFPGDYIIKSVTVDGVTYDNVKWIIGDLDYSLGKPKTIDENNAETPELLANHHVLIFPEKPIGSARMNATNITTGGYVASEMWTVTMPKYAAGIEAAFGAEHILKYTDFLSAGVNTNVMASNGAGKGIVDTDANVTDITVNLFNEPQVTGVCYATSGALNIGYNNTQISAFRNKLIFEYYWLSGVVRADSFVSYCYGIVTSDPASTTLPIIVYFLLC